MDCSWRQDSLAKAWRSLFQGAQGPTWRLGSLLYIAAVGYCLCWGMLCWGMLSSVLMAARATAYGRAEQVV
jgi:hypothetical protein